MNRRNVSTAYQSRAPPQGTKNYVLFTWSKCGQCKELKNSLMSNPQTRNITEYDLDNIKDNPNLMRVFRQISPNNNVPAMAVYNNGVYERSAIGMRPIMNML
jgi:glutaredoxin